MKKWYEIKGRGAAKLKVGDLVCHKFGNVVMTVEKMIGRDLADCKWFAHGEFHVVRFKRRDLRKLKSEGTNGKRS